MVLVGWSRDGGLSREAVVEFSHTTVLYVMAARSGRRPSLSRGSLAREGCRNGIK